MSEIKKSTKCGYPWFNLNSNTDGSVKLCCAILENHHLGDSERKYNFGRDAIEDIWGGQDLMKIRQAMRSGEKPATCGVCWKLEEQNIESSRLAINKENWILPESEPTALPESLELRLGNKCNLKCLSCWPMSSSTVAEERKRALSYDTLPPWMAREWSGELKDLNETNLGWFKSDRFRANFEKLAPQLRRLYLTGGEPTLIVENVEHLNRLRKAGNTACAISFTTNLSIWNEEFYNELKHFTNVEIQMSVDGFGKLNDYLRFPSTFQIVEKNLERILERLPTARIKIFTVVSVLNFLWLAELGRFLNEKFKNRDAVWSPIILQAPEYLATSVAEKPAIVEAKRRINEFSAELASGANGKLWHEYATKLLISHFDAAARQPKNRPLSDKSRDFLITMQKLRGNTHPFADEFEKLGVWRD